MNRSLAIKCRIQHHFFFRFFCRSFLEGASGFQSLQFRLLENKLGIRSDQRVLYQKQNYKCVFMDVDAKGLEELKKSEKEPSLLDVVEVD